MKAMRTVLAVDPLLAEAVRKKLPGTVEIYTRERMREEGDDTVKAAALRAPSVLVVGAKKWSPLRWVERWQLPRTTPVVMLLPSVPDEYLDRAAKAGVYSIVPLDGTVGALASAVYAEAILAWSSRESPPLLPVLVGPSPRPRPAAVQPGRVLPLVPAS